MAKKEKIHPLQVVKYLPGTNCKECGLMTCLAFGVALQAREKKIEDCPLLLTEKYRSFHDFLYEQFGKDLDVENTGLMIDRDRCLGCGDCVIVCNKAQFDVVHGTSTLLPRNVPPVFKIVNGKIEVINWNSCKRCDEPPGICRVCEERCAFGALELVK